MTFTAKPSKSVAIQMADEGYKVYISARSKDKLEKITSDYSGKGEIISAPLDVRSRRSSD